MSKRKRHSNQRAAEHDVKHSVKHNAAATKNIVTKDADPFDPILVVLQGVATSLVLATVLFPGESLVRYGSGLLLTILWFLLAGCCAARAVWVGNTNTLRFFTPQSGTAGKICDIFVFLFFLWTTLSFVVHLLPGRGTLRYSFNSYFSWMEFAAAYYVFRNIFIDSKIRTTFLAILISAAVSQAVCGFHQRIVEFPQLQREYEQNREFYLRENGITPGSPEQELFENRIRNTQPLGTYSLTNTLAGVLAPMFVLVVGVAIFNLRNKKSKRLFLPLFSGGIIAGIFALCLILTQSRSGCIAAFFGVMCVLIAFFFSERFSRKRAGAIFRAKNIVIALISLVIFCGIISAGWFLGGWTSEMIASGAKKSLGYRVEYWISTTKMIEDYPLFGCGPGNFQHLYPAYKLPLASEEIADPHNFVMEIASNLGLPALVFFIVIFCIVLLYGINEKTSLSSKNDDAQGYTLVSPSNCIGAVGAFLGFGVIFCCYIVSDLDLTPERLVILFFTFFVSLIIVVSLFFSKSYIPKSVLKITILTLFVNLLTAGGIAYPNLAIIFWMLAAMILSENESANENSAPETNHSAKMKAVPAIYCCVFLVLGFTCYKYSYFPCVSSSIAEASARSAANLSGAIKCYENMVQADKYSFENRLHLFRASLEMYKMQFQDKDLRRAIDVQQAAVELAPFSANLRKDIGNALMDAYDSTGKRTLLTLAIERYRQAVELYPNHAKTHAPLAVALWKEGQKTEALAEAKTAIQLDDATPHSDQKLAAPLREEIERILHNE